MSRDWIENGPRSGDGLCYACGSRGLGRVAGSAYEMRCRACGFECVMKIKSMPDERMLNKLGVGV